MAPLLIASADTIDRPKNSENIEGNRSNLYGMPNEILYNIFKITPLDAGTLSNIALCSRKFNDVITPTLYSTFVYKGWCLRSNERFMTTLKKKPELAKHVKVLEVIGKMGGKVSVEEFNQEHNLTRLLLSLPKLESISFSKPHAKVPFLRALEETMRFQTCHRFADLKVVSVDSSDVSDLSQVELDDLDFLTPTSILDILCLPMEILIANTFCLEVDFDALHSQNFPTSTTVTRLDLLESRFYTEGLPNLLALFTNLTDLRYRVNNKDDPTNPPEDDFPAFKDALEPYQTKPTSLKLSYANPSEAFNGESDYPCLQHPIGSLKAFTSLEDLELPMCLLFGRDAKPCVVLVAGLFPRSLLRLSLNAVDKDWDADHCPGDYLEDLARARQDYYPKLESVEINAPFKKWMENWKLKDTFASAGLELIINFLES
ncbi:MAG: hypothetical protein M1820_003839 [Bogoriella megaspora]|nr:MAG: hypothetical protein M1820_003839 [Bogoriella megaspora]